MTDADLAMFAWVLVQSAVGAEYVRLNRKLRAILEAEAEDLQAPIDRMMASAEDNAESERLWAARLPHGACARKLGRRA